jgi:glutaminyl-peptide cyclotransferase
MQMKQLLVFLTITIYFYSCGNSSNTAENKKTVDDVPQIKYTIVNHLPHDTTSFTEGLLIDNHQLFESTGSPEDMPHTKSILGIVDFATGKINKKVELNRNVFFGEGIVIFKGRIYQLTYKNRLCFVYDVKTFKKLEQFSFPNKEGWGLTTDGTNLIMSDGTDNLSYVNPINFQMIKKLQVTSNHYAVDHLNELEYIKGFIYANVWPSNKIVKIDPASGYAVGMLDLTPLQEEASGKNPQSQETNGIAYDALSDKIYVTGKMWPEIFQITFSH